MEKGRKNNPSLFPFFSFKNENTDEAVREAISENEGVLPENLDNYISFASTKAKAKIMSELKFVLKKLAKDYNLPFSDFVGLIHIVCTDITMERILMGNKVTEEIMKRYL